MKSIFSTLEKKLNVAFFSKSSQTNNCTKKKKKPFLLDLHPPLKSSTLFKTSFLHQYADNVILSSGRFAIISFQMCETFSSRVLFSPCPQITLLAFKRLQKAVSKSLFCAFSSECHLPSEQDVNKSDVILFLKQSSPVTVFQHVSVKF